MPVGFPSVIFSLIPTATTLSVSTTLRILLTCDCAPTVKLSISPCGAIVKRSSARTRFFSEAMISLSLSNSIDLKQKPRQPAGIELA